MKQRIVMIILVLFTSAAVFESCKKSEPDDLIEENPGSGNETYFLEYGSLPEPQLPDDNLPTLKGVELGRMLFYEMKLSANNAMSCASCHDQGSAFADVTAFSLGVQGLPGTRNSMAVFNMAWNMNEFFWDGRAHLLRHQSLMPIEDELEMNDSLPNVISKLEATPIYPARFKEAFGTEEINSELLSMALEQFMNSIVSYNSKFDDYQAGLVELTEQEERGRFLFFTEYNPAFPEASGADCQRCHGGANFENDSYMNNGLDTDDEFVDFGRENVTENTLDRAKFKVTYLRNIALTSPYMHDGRFNTLAEVVDHYNLVKNSSTLDGSFQKQLPDGLQLTDNDKAALVAFLKTLTDYQLINDPRYSNPF